MSGLVGFNNWNFSEFNTDSDVASKLALLGYLRLKM